MEIKISECEDFFALMTCEEEEERVNIEKSGTISVWKTFCADLWKYLVPMTDFDCHLNLKFEKFYWKMLDILK
jgi:hypothetical protein